jgi:hypothetical protein
MVLLYGCIGCLFMVAESIRRKSVKLTLNEIKTVILKSLGYGTVMLAAAYLYYFLGIKTE